MQNSQLSSFCKELRRQCGRESYNIVQRLVKDIVTHGYQYHMGKGTRHINLLVKLPDPGGSKQEFSIFQVNTKGEIGTYTYWLPGQLERAGLSRNTGERLVLQMIRTLRPQISPTAPLDRDKTPTGDDAWYTFGDMNELTRYYNNFLEFLKEARTEIATANRN